MKGLKKAVAVTLCAAMSVAALNGCAFGKNDESAEEIERLEKKIGKLKDNVEELEGEVDRLKAENEILMEKNDELSDENDRLLAELNNEYDYNYNDNSSYWVSSSDRIYVDEDGNPIDLGGMEIIIRDWWSNPDSRYWPTNDYEEARMDYYEWLEETYNFKVVRTAISDWNTVPSDYVDYVTSGGDDCNYIFVLRKDAAVASAMQEGLMYDLSTLDCLDFSFSMYRVNNSFRSYSQHGCIYSMATGYAEPGLGVYFNKSILIDAGIDPDSIYQMQIDGKWNWDSFEDLLRTAQMDIDGDGEIDIFGLATNPTIMTQAAVYANGGEFVGYSNGRYTCEVESAATIEALEWVDSIYAKYKRQYYGWDEYQSDFISGKAAFLVEYGYAGLENGWITNNSYGSTNGNIGFVAFPSGNKVNGGEYYNYSEVNPVVIPACYDADRAWKIAFVWNLWSMDPPGYDGCNPYWSSYREGIFDQYINQTVDLMCHGCTIVNHSVMIPNLDVSSQLGYYIDGGGNAREMAARAADEWQVYIDAVN
ncbi:MAG: extracellular solute-binding protein [Lachnospiraceae bacterium]|nr:extracellular solute-binding protein [Lachnospiraceae bacterium]